MLSRTISMLFNSSCRGVSTQAPKWDIVAAVCVERLPLVTPHLSKLEATYKEVLNKIEFEKSYKSDHEIRNELDIIHFEKLKKDATDIELEEISKITAQDFEEASTDEFMKFTAAPLETEADKKNDQTSLDRNLQSHLVLLVEQQLGSQNRFVLPQGKHSGGETLRQTAERVLKESCGEDLTAQIYGNAPVGYYKYKYPKELNGVSGAKVFFYYARHFSGQVNKSKQYKWVNRKELQSALPSPYHNSINDFLIEERV